MTATLVPGAVRSLEDLQRIRDRNRAALSVRLAAAGAPGPSLADAPEVHILVCGGTGCQAGKSAGTRAALEAAIREHGLADRVRVVQVGCFGFCRMGPVVMVEPGGTFYCQVTSKDAAEIIRDHILGGEPVQRLLYQPNPRERARALTMADNPFYRGQHRLVLQNCGVIDPENIEEAIGAGRYFALAKALLQMTPDQVVTELKASGLRGRGGAGFPTGLKWELTQKVQSDVKYVTCNADEGDPGAFMDRSILEGDPHAVLEAMAIAGYAIGAHEGYIYIRAEYPVAVERLRIALDQARQLGLLGQDILGTGFAFDIGIRLGAGAFVCGEETALMASVEGKRGMPRPRPPFPSDAGLWGRPTLNNNVETYANIPPIILNGGDWYADLGTEKSKGTKVFALAGNVNNTGLVEVPMGITLRQIVYDLGGGIPKGKAFKAAQTGGPSGGCIPAEHLDTPMDYESLAALGSIVGSGGLIIMDQDSCMVDVARFYLEFTQDESCGKCPPCRIGTKRMLEILDRIVEGRGEAGDIERLESLASSIKATSLCGLGQTAPNPVLSSLRYFRDEYEAHIRDKRCPAGKCKALVHYRVDPDKCIGCTLCTRVCPSGAITGALKKPHAIDPTLCAKCGSCYDVCRPKAIER
ncbi:MAG: NADH-quinone oxidoreductase subunit NuoF [Bacillota bacterium]